MGNRLDFMEKLSEALPYILHSECVLFIGAGVSQIAGCYDWNTVVRELLQHPIMVHETRGKNLQKTIFSNEELIEFCYRALNKANEVDEFWGTLRGAIQKDPIKFQESYLPLVKKIRQIKPPPKIITTNIDSCLEETGLFPLSRVYYEPCDFVITKFKEDAIFHIHGYVEKFKEALWTRTRYSPRYMDKTFRKFLRYVFSKYSVIFLGCSLTEIEIRSIISEAKSIDRDIQHFALFPSDDNIQEGTNQIFKDLCNINIIEYGARGNLHNVVSEWVEKYFPKVAIQVSKKEYRDRIIRVI